MVVQEFHTQEVLPSLGSCPVDSVELWVSSNFHIRPVVTQLEDRAVHFVQKYLVLAQTKIRELAGESMRQIVAVSSQLLDRLDVIDVKCLDKIAELEQASLELICMTNPDVLLIRLERHPLTKTHIPIEQLDRAHDHRFDEFVRHEDEPRVSQAL